MSDGPVHLDQLACSRPRVELVDVLGDDRVEQTAALERGERQVGAVGLLVLEGLETLAVEAPEPLRIAPEDVDVRDGHPVAEMVVRAADGRRLGKGDMRWDIFDADASPVTGLRVVGG